MNTISFEERGAQFDILHGQFEMLVQLIVVHNVNGANCQSDTTTVARVNHE